MNLHRRLVIAATGIAVLAAAAAAIALGSPGSGARASQASEQHPNQVLEWNQIFIETLIATNTANSSSQRLGAIVHTAIFDAYNGIERRYTPIFVQNVDGNGERLVPPGASRRAAVIAAAYTALVGLFPARATQLSDSYAASLAALSDDGGDGGQSRERGIAWGTQVAQAVLAWRAADGFSASYPPFTGGTAVGQWRPIPPATAMSAQGLAFTAPFVVESNTQFRPGPPRALASATYTAGLQRSQGARSPNRIDAYRRSDGARAFLGGQRQRPLESGGQPDRARQPSVDVRQQSAPRRPEHRHGRHGIHDLEREATLRRRSDRSDLAAADGDHAGGHGRHRGDSAGSRLAPARHDTVPPGISCGPPGPERRCCDRPLESLRRRPDVHADDVRTAQSDVHQHLASTRRRQQRPDLGRDALPQHRCDQRRRRRSDRRLRRCELDAVAPRSA